MLKLIAYVHAYLRDVKGATAIEYGLIAGGISLAIVAAVFAFGDSLEAMFTTIGGAMDSAAGEVETDRGATDGG
jgi:pilus assembly protein Flp/PilA